MRKIYQFLKSKKAVEGDLGIEIECEGNNLNQNDVPLMWKCEDDGSLRGQFPNSRCEYVLVKPIKANAVEAALDALIKSQPNAKYSFSFRTSVHVHLNVSECTQLDVLNIIYTFLLIEEPLLTYCGKERKGNRFCLRLQDAEGILDIVNAFIKKGVAGVEMIGENNIRYSALNMASLNKYGSLEFRSMRGTLDKAVLVRWTEAIMSIRKYALTKKDPMDILQEYHDLGPHGFLGKVLGDNFKYFDYPKAPEDMDRSFSLSIDIPHLWKHYGQWMFKDEEGLKEKKPLAKKELEPADEGVRFPDAPVAGIFRAPEPVNIVFDEFAAVIPEG